MVLAPVLPCRTGPTDNLASFWSVLSIESAQLLLEAAALRSVDQCTLQLSAVDHQRQIQNFVNVMYWPMVIAS